MKNELALVAIRSHGFVLDDQTRIGGRLVFKKKSWVILSPTSDSPWWTVQRKSRSSVDWFVDFPVQVNPSVVAKFVDLCDGLQVS